MKLKYRQNNTDEMINYVKYTFTQKIKLQN